MSATLFPFSVFDCYRNPHTGNWNPFNIEAYDERTGKWSNALQLRGCIPYGNDNKGVGTN